MNYDTPDDIWADINECLSHRDMDPDCDICTEEVEQRSGVIEGMGRDSARIVQSIVGQGGPAVPPSLIEAARLEVLIDTVLGDPKNRLKFEGEVGRRVMLIIKGAHEQMKQPVLHGANGQPLRAVKDIPQA